MSDMPIADIDGQLRPSPVPPLTASEAKNRANSTIAPAEHSCAGGPHEPLDERRKSSPRPASTYLDLLP